MVVAAKSRAQTNQRMFELWGADEVKPSSGKLAVLVDIRVRGSVQLGGGEISREGCEVEDSRWVGWDVKQRSDLGIFVMRMLPEMIVVRLGAEESGERHLLLRPVL